MQVNWSLTVTETRQPVEAAQKALARLRDPESDVTVFTVVDEETGMARQIDLTEPGDREL